MIALVKVAPLRLTLIKSAKQSLLVDMEKSKFGVAWMVAKSKL